MGFDEMSKGDQYLVMLSREYEILVRVNRIHLEYLDWALRTYEWTPEELERWENDRILTLKDIEYYSELMEKGGAENGEYLTEFHKNSESPKDRFTGVSCTTVL